VKRIVVRALIVAACLTGSLSSGGDASPADAPQIHLWSYTGQTNRGWLPESESGRVYRTRPAETRMPSNAPTTRARAARQRGDAARSSKRV
jgi:hypothetical protein